MMKCWKASPAERPSFSELQETFAGMLLQEVNYMQLSSLTDGIYALPVDALPTRWELTGHLIGRTLLLGLHITFYIHTVHALYCTITW